MGVWRALNFARKLIVEPVAKWSRIRKNKKRLIWRATTAPHCPQDLYTLLPEQVLLSPLVLQPRHKRGDRLAFQSTFDSSSFSTSLSETSSESRQYPNLNNDSFIPFLGRWKSHQSEWPHNVFCSPVQNYLLVSATTLFIKTNQGWDSGLVSY